MTHTRTHISILTRHNKLCAIHLLPPFLLLLLVAYTISVYICGTNSFKLKHLNSTSIGAVVWIMNILPLNAAFCGYPPVHYSRSLSTFIGSKRRIIHLIAIISILRWIWFWIFAYVWLTLTQMDWFQQKSPQK